MLRHLGQVAREVRDEHGGRRSQIAARIGRESAAVGNFENGKTWQALDEMVIAYADEFGIDATDLWRRALERWETERKRG